MIMRDGSDEFVGVRRGQHPGEPSEITVNCPDKVGLGCDFARIVLEFGLTVVRGDLSTDGRWCFVVLWVVPKSAGYGVVKWSLLKQRLAAVCPSAQGVLVPERPVVDLTKEVFVLQVCTIDRAGLLNSVTQTLWELELTIHRVKVSTSPEGKAVNLFFITDKSGKLPLDKQRKEDICAEVRNLLGAGTAVDLTLAGPEWGGLDCAPYLPSSVSKDLFDDGQFELISTVRRSLPATNLSGQTLPTMLKPVIIDNTISPVHTSMQIVCKDRKGLFYDCMRTLKDNDLQVSFGRISTLEKGTCEISLFVLQSGRKITDIHKQDALCDSMLQELVNPLRVSVVTRGPDTELLVAAPIENCGRGRPRVLFDVTYALKLEKICIFKADIGRHVVEKRPWEVYRFLLVEKQDFPLTNSRIRKEITEKVKAILMG